MAVLPALQLRRLGLAGHLAGYLAEFRAELRVVGLRQGTCGPEPVEELPGDSVEGRIGDEPHGRRTSLLDGGDRGDAAADDHRGIHEGRRVQAVHRYPDRLELTGQAEGERGQREL